MVINDTGNYETVECEFYVNNILIEKVIGADMMDGSYILQVFNDDGDALTLIYNTITKESKFTIQKQTNDGLKPIAIYKYNWSVIYKLK